MTCGGLIPRSDSSAVRRSASGMSASASAPRNCGVRSSTVPGGGFAPAGAAVGAMRMTLGRIGASGGPSAPLSESPMRLAVGSSSTASPPAPARVPSSACIVVSEAGSAAGGSAPDLFEDRGGIESESWDLAGAKSESGNVPSREQLLANYVRRVALQATRRNRVDQRCRAPLDASLAKLHPCDLTKQTCKGRRRGNAKTKAHVGRVPGRSQAKNRHAADDDGQVGSM